MVQAVYRTPYTGSTSLDTTTLFPLCVRVTFFGLPFFFFVGFKGIVEPTVPPSLYPKPCSD